MEARHLVDNYTGAVDEITIVICITLLILIRWVLFFSTDRMFTYLKRAVHFVLGAATFNLIFYFVCTQFPEAAWLLLVVRALYHLCLLCSLFIFLQYIREMLGIKGRLVRNMVNVTNIVFCVGLIFDSCSQFTGFGFRVDSDGLWYDPLVNPYTACYVYAALLMLLMLLFYSKRLVRPVRHCLVATEFIIAAMMVVGGIQNSNTFATFTYALPIIVVMILLHSKPFDDATGAMEAKSFESFIVKAVKKNMALDYMVLQFAMNVGDKIPAELGKVLSTFWHRYFTSASLFMTEGDVFVLAVPRTKRNGDTRSKIIELFEKVFPRYYAQYQLKYRMIALFDIDFVRSGKEASDIFRYLISTMDENETLIADKKLTERLRIMRDVNENLADIERKSNLEDERVLVYCQPIKNSRTGEYDTAEALMRLSIPGHPFITPDLFIPLAEYYGSIHSLTRIMLHKVCRQIRELEKEGYALQRVSVNFVVSEIRDANICEEILGIITQNGVDPAKIGIELTESQNESDFNIVRDRISYLKQHGMTIYLDDFGTGYSNLDRIIKLGLDVIKYDRSILLAAQEDENAAYMVQHFAEAFIQFKYKLLFEGVETDEQEKLCLDCGADYLQGYKFSKPIPIEQLRDFLSKA